MQYRRQLCVTSKHLGTQRPLPPEKIREFVIGNTLSLSDSRQVDPVDFQEELLKEGSTRWFQLAQEQITRKKMELQENLKSRNAEELRSCAKEGDLTSQFHLYLLEGKPSDLLEKVCHYFDKS